jgi:tellurite resistance protein TehA-like permease
VLHTLPPGKFAATSFIAIAPTSIIAVSLFKLTRLFEAGTPIDISADAVRAFSVIGILVAWGFAAWAFVMAVVVAGSYARRMDLPYALSWWAYTFPLGALAVASGVTWNVTNLASVEWFYVLVLVALATAWVVVAVRTAVAIWNGQVLQSPHEGAAHAGEAP